MLQKTFLDELFDHYLRPLVSKNARLIYKILYESKKRNLTTLDMQIILQKYSVSLNKKELNNWLNFLKDSGLVTKADKRGKPTTIDYNDRYTFDLWKITKEGYQIAEILPRFKDILYIEEFKEEITKDLLFKEKILSDIILKITVKDILIYLNKFENNEILYKKLIDQLIIEKGTLKKLMKVKGLNNKPLFDIHSKKLNLIEEILKILGFSKKNVVISTSIEGNNILHQ